MLKKILLAPAALLFAVMLFCPSPADAGVGFGVYAGGVPGYYACPADPYAYPYALPAYCYQYYGYPYLGVYPYFGFGWGGGWHGGYYGGHAFHDGGHHGGGFHGGGFHGGGHRGGRR
ncbi:MAG TPA: hypothetical protein VMA31_19000 [Bryobacteraceae bacterium]|nr:hypothetical protein [Bryobacteraceae bacterium]